MEPVRRTGSPTDGPVEATIMPSPSSPKKQPLNPLVITSSLVTFNEAQLRVVRSDIGIAPLSSHDSICRNTAMHASTPEVCSGKVRQHASLGPATRRLRNVFAEPLSVGLNVNTSDGSTSAKGGEKKTTAHPLYQHTSEEIQFLRQKLHGHYLFEALPENELKRLVEAFQPYELNHVTTDTVVIQQGEIVTQDNAFFYILYSGRCVFVVNEEIVHDPAIPGDCFGELALLYNCPRAATVRALTSISFVRFFRIHQKLFRRILRQENEQAEFTKLNLLDGVPFLHQIPFNHRVQLAQAMTPKLFNRGDILLQKGDDIMVWTIIERGNLRVTNIDRVEGDDVGLYAYQDISMGAGDAFGERSILLNRPVVFDIVADTDGLAFTIDKHVFTSVLQGSLKRMVEMSVDIKKLKGVKIFQDSIDGDIPKVLRFLAGEVREHRFFPGTVLCTEGQPLRYDSAAFYFVRQGEVRLQSKENNRNDVVLADYYFGADQLLLDRYPGLKASYTATVSGTEICVLGVLTLSSCRKVINTQHMGYSRQMIKDELIDSLRLMPGCKLSISDFNLHTILGAGTFGQVWLVSRKDTVDSKFQDAQNNCIPSPTTTSLTTTEFATTNKKKHAYALKIQSKYELIKQRRAKSVVHEKLIMEKLRHPFVGGLITTFQDADFIYMVLKLVQGGELYSVMSLYPFRRMNENDAVFYVSCITDGLSYIHRHGYVYRDLKPENVLIDAKGYPVIIDFGFAKYVIDKTFTLCGTPLYIAPEVILNRGHNHGADHWSLGCLTYEMLSGETPFYVEGMDQSNLFRAIVKGKFSMPNFLSDKAQDFISGLLQRHASQRLGSTRNGIDDVLHHPWLNQINHYSVLFKDIQPPYVPEIDDPFDASNFDDWSHITDKMKIQYPKLNEADTKVFIDF